MPGSATLPLQQAVLGHTLGFQAMTPITSVFLGLCLAAPPPDSLTGGTEVSAGGYARQMIAFGLSASPNIAANTATIEFSPALATWGSLGFFELWSSITFGARLYWGPLVDPVDGITPITRQVLGGDIVRFPAGVIQVRAT